jgi:hypothetical protein
MMPDFLIIGAQKCGTTSLYYYLTQHPDIVPATQKEVHFFDLNFHKGIEWYQAQFPLKTNPQQLTGESSPYYVFHPCVPRRIYQLFPNIKLIVLLRDPITRAWSHYHHEVRLGFENLSFEQAIKKESERLNGEVEKLLINETYYSFNHQHYTYLARGIYSEQLERWMSYFPQQQCLILKSEEFYKNPAQTLKQVFKFLEVPVYPLDYSIHYNIGDYPPLSSETQQWLISYFQPYNQTLQEKFGITFKNPE